MLTVVHHLHDAPHSVALVVLWGLLAAGLWASLTRSRLPVLALVAMAGLWLLTNTSMEGWILLGVYGSHGLTHGDLAAPIVVGGALYARLLRSSWSRLQAAVFLLRVPAL